MRLLLVGYYGYRNWGDEGSLVTLLQRLPAKNCTVLSGDPPFTERIYGVNAVPRMAFRAVRHALRQSDAVVFGGGSLLQDTTSLRSLIYYLTLIGWGLRARKPVWLLAQGMGPFQRPISRWLVRRTLNRLEWVSLRDPDSARALEQIDVRVPLRIDADLTWALIPQPTQLPLPEGKWIGLTPRPWQDWRVQDAFATLACAIQEAGYQPLLIPMQESQDRPLCEAIAQQSGATVLPPVGHPAVLMGMMAHLHAMIAMRLHGAIFALSQSVPTLCIDYDPKVRALAQQVNAPLASLSDSDTLIPAWQAFHSQIDMLREAIPERILSLREKSAHLLNIFVLDKSGV